MHWLRDGIIEAILGIALTSLFYIVVRRIQRLHPRTKMCDGRQYLILSPNLGLLVAMILGFFLMGSCCVGWWVILLSSDGQTPGTDSAIDAVAISIGLFAFVMAAGFLFFSLYLWKSRVFVFNDGVLFQFFMRKRVFLAWSDIERVDRHWKDVIVIFSKQSLKRDLDPHWNGMAYLFFCFELFLKEEQWPQAREFLMETLCRKGNVDNLRSQFNEFLLNHPLDSFETDTQPA